jgi:hypothetical protein
MLTSKLETLMDDEVLQSQDTEERSLTTAVNWQHYETLLNSWKTALGSASPISMAS